MKLYELTDDYFGILERIGESGEVDEETAALLEALDDEIEVKAENVAKVIRTLELEADAINQEAKRLADRARAKANSAAHLKDYLHRNLEALGKKKVEGEVLTVSLRKKPPSVEVVDASVIPDAFTEERVETRVDKRAILQEWKETGETVQGCVIHKDGHSLQIR